MPFFEILFRPSMLPLSLTDVTFDLDNRFASRELTLRHIREAHTDGWMDKQRAMHKGPQCMSTGYLQNTFTTIYQLTATRVSIAQKCVIMELKRRMDSCLANIIIIIAVHWLNCNKVLLLAWKYKGPGTGVRISQYPNFNTVISHFWGPDIPISQFQIQISFTNL